MRYFAQALIVGTATSLHLLADQGSLHAKIAPAFWDELRKKGVLHPAASVPG